MLPCVLPYTFQHMYRYSLASDGFVHLKLLFGMLALSPPVVPSSAHTHIYFGLIENGKFLFPFSSIILSHDITMVFQSDLSPASGSC